MCQRHETQLVKVVFCTAVPKDDHDKRDRHNTFNAVQTARGVTVLKGHHVIDPSTGLRSEKQSDINVALSVVLDAHDGLYDYAYLLSADSDQAATARVFRDRFPNLKLCSVAPPNRPVSEKVASYADDSFVLNKPQIETCVMPQYVRGKTGHMIRRPDAYATPEGWVHPDNRPRRKNST